MEKKISLDKRHKVALAFASRSAVPRRKILKPTEMESLMDQLFACENPYQDPLGRPTLLNWSVEELSQAFQKR
jgi:DNA mismatch repair protein MutL